MKDLADRKFGESQIWVMKDSLPSMVPVTEHPEMEPPGNTEQPVAGYLCNVSGLEKV